MNLGIFRHAAPCLLWLSNMSQMCCSGFIKGDTWGRARRGGGMKGRGIANIHPRQLFMNIKEHLWMSPQWMKAGSHHLLPVNVNRTNKSRLGYIIMNMFCRPVWMKFVVRPQCYKKKWHSLCLQEREKKARWEVDAGSPFSFYLSASSSLSTLAHAGPSPWQRMRKQVLLLKSQTLGSTLIWGGCDKQPEPEPKALQISQHRGRSFAARGNQDLI